MLFLGWQRNVWLLNIWCDLVDYQLSGERSFAELGSSLQAWTFSSHWWVFLTLVFCLPAFFAFAFYSFLHKWPSWSTFFCSPTFAFSLFLFAPPTTLLFIIRLFRGKVHFSLPCLFKLICRAYNFFISCRFFISIRPESDHCNAMHWLCLSLTHSSHSLTD